MALNVVDYVQFCLTNADKVLLNLAKICLYNGIAGDVDLWKKDIFKCINSVFNLHLKNDYSYDETKYAFSIGFIESTLGKDFEDYSDILPYFIDAAYTEGEMPDKEECLKCAMENKERICTFLYRIEGVLSIGDELERYQELLSLVQEF